MEHGRFFPAPTSLDLFLLSWDRRSSAVFAVFLHRAAATGLVTRCFGRPFAPAGNGTANFRLSLVAPSHTPTKSPDLPSEVRDSSCFRCPSSSGFRHFRIAEC